MTNDPSKPIPAVEDMQEDWAVVDALMGGTKAMRKAGVTFLPKWPKEDKDAYDARLKASTLLPAYSETVHNMTGRVFAEPIVVGENVPANIAEYLRDIDRQGNNVEVWAQTAFSRGLAKGICHALIDYPKTTAPDGTNTVATRADELAAGVRPYAVMINPSQIVGWKSTVENGAQVLTQLRIMESVEEEDPDNKFVSKHVTQVRVLEPGKWEIYRKEKVESGREEWRLHEDGTTTLTKIPLATFYTKRTGIMTATPPLMELGHLNIKHWQSQSDQDHILHYARVPILFGAGFDEEKDIAVGGGTMIRSDNADAKLNYVEHGGAAIEAGRVSLQDLLDDMRIAGAKLLHKEKQATKTAAQAEEEAAQEMSPLETMAGQFEDFLDQVLQLFADWMKLPEGGNVQVNGNFDIDYAPETTLPLLKGMVDSGYLSQETLFKEVQRRGVLNGDLKWLEEREKIADQGPSLGMIGRANANG